MSPSITLLLLNATWETLAMVLISGLVAVLLGLPLGVMLFMTQKHQMLEGITIHRTLAALINIIRSIPFIILLILITPVTRFIVGTTIGTVAAMVPLALSAIPFFARIVESALKEVSYGLIEAAYSMGTTPWQTIWYVLIPESLPSMMRGMTLTLITLVGYSAMAGAIGGGGLGDVAIRYGYQRFEPMVMLVTVAILVILVQGLQMLGDWIVKYYGANRSEQRGVIIAE